MTHEEAYSIASYIDQNKTSQSSQRKKNHHAFLVPASPLSNPKNKKAKIYLKLCSFLFSSIMNKTLILPTETHRRFYHCFPSQRTNLRCPSFETWEIPRILQRLRRLHDDYSDKKFAATPAKASAEMESNYREIYPSSARDYKEIGRRKKKE